ncbi:MAG TPA: cytochrome c biogenesis protein ResB [Elusimicrobiales bacterium]|nr:cytochrome c biogenesis protein ResB [Elusimicrobiales bacterium]HPO95612.1 cytochrome c biogenesis protein ResB [Elusimicrobiales bacterium]
MLGKIINFLSSIKIFFSVSVIISIFLIYDTIFNKKESVIHSFPFLFLSGVLFINIFVCTLSRILSGFKGRKSFYFIHIGILITILGFFLSSIFRFEAEVGLKKNKKTNRVEFNGYLYELPFVIKLNSFKIEYYKYPELFIRFANKKYPCKKGIEIKNGEDFYKIENCFNDFSIDEKGNYINKTVYFNNPAALLYLNEKEKIWLFLNRQNHFNQALPLSLEVLNDDIRDFKSEIEIYYKGRTYNFDVYVNDPINFEGYKIYQTSYDPSYGEFSVLTIKRDKWVWVIFLGFIVISAGVFLWIL